MTDLEILSFNLQEDKFPHFSQGDLEKLLSIHEDVQKASYEGCLMKAYDNTSDFGPISTTVDSKYWLRLAKKFKSNNSLNGKSKIRSMKRADEV